MDEQRQFLSLLAVLKRKLFIEHVSRYLHLGLLIISATLLIVAISARVLVIVYLSETLLVISCVLFIAAIVGSLLTKPSNHMAATLYDDYVGDDRVKTALLYLKDESVMSRLQRRDALSHMENQLIEVGKRKVQLIDWKKLAMIFILISVTSVALSFPNAVMETAAEQKVDKRIAKETKKELRRLPNQEKNKELEELKKLATEAKTSDELLKKLVQQEKELEEKRQTALKEEQKLNELSDTMKEFKKFSKALSELDTEMLPMALDELQKKIPTLSEEQQKALERVLSEVTNQTVPPLSELSDEQLEELLKQLEINLEKMVASATELSQVTNLQQQVQKMATSLNQNMASAGLQSSNQLSFASSTNPSTQMQNNGQSNQSGQNQGGTNSNTNGKGQNGQGQSQNGQGQGTGGGSGQGAGTGNGTGGSGSSGNGTGTGTGTGTGFGQGSRNLTIPEKLEGNETVENDFGKIGEGSGEQQVAPDAPVLKGSVRPYEEVYGQYEQSYRESVERMDLPGYLEDVVKDYFSELNPGGE